MNRIDQYICNLHAISPQLYKLLTQTQYDIFQDLIHNIADETSWEEKYAMLYGRIDELLKHEYLENGCYEDLKIHIYALLKTFTVEHLYDASLSKIHSHIDMMDEYNTKYERIMTDIEEHQKMSRNSQTKDIVVFFYALTTILSLYDTYRDEYYERIIDDNLQIKLHQKGTQLISRMSKYATMYAGFKSLLQTSEGEKLMNLLCDSEFLSQKHSTYVDYVGGLWCYAICLEIINDLYMAIQEIDDIIEDDDSIGDGIVCYDLLQEDFAYKLKEYKKDSNTMTLQNDIQQDMEYLISIIQKMIPLYRQDDIKNLKSMNEMIKHLISSHDEEGG